MDICSRVPVEAWRPPRACCLCSSPMGMNPWEVGRHLSLVHHLEHSAVVLADLMFRGPFEAEYVHKILLDIGSGKGNHEFQDCESTH